MEQDEKKCSRCQKFKSSKEFYRQGDRFESCCKECKRQKRGAKPESQDFVPEPPPLDKPVELNHPPRSYEDLGFTREEFLEIVDFFQELIRLDQKGSLR